MSNLKTEYTPSTNNNNNNNNNLLPKIIEDLVMDDHFKAKIEERTLSDGDAYVTWGYIYYRYPSKPFDTSSLDKHIFENLDLGKLNCDGVLYKQSYYTHSPDYTTYSPSIKHYTSGYCSFQETKLKGFSFRIARLYSLSFQDANLASSVFVNAKLNTINFRGSNLQNANFSGASQQIYKWESHGNLDFSNANLTNANFAHVHFKRVKLKNAITDNIDFTGATFDCLLKSGAVLANSRNLLSSNLRRENVNSAIAHRHYLLATSILESSLFFAGKNYHLLDKEHLLTLIIKFCDERKYEIDKLTVEQRNIFKDGMSKTIQNKILFSENPVTSLTFKHHAYSFLQKIIPFFLKPIPKLDITQIRDLATKISNYDVDLILKGEYGLGILAKNDLDIEKAVKHFKNVPKESEFYKAAQFELANSFYSRQLFAEAATSFKESGHTNDFAYASSRCYAVYNNAAMTSGPLFYCLRNDRKKYEDQGYIIKDISLERDDDISETTRLISQ